MSLVQPFYLRPDDAPDLPQGWRYLTTEEATVQLKPGKLFEKKTAQAIGRVPILSQGETDFIGFHDEAPGVFADAQTPVVTFANHTCAMRLMTAPFSCIQNIFPKVGKSGEVDTQYFFYAAKGRVNLSDYKGHHPLFRQALIPVPPMPIQRRIASILGAYDDVIEVNRRRIAVLEEMARGLFEEWFVRFRFPGHEAVPILDTRGGPLPAGWGYGPFTEVADVLSGGTPKKDKAEYWGGEIPFFTPRDSPSTAWAFDTLANVTYEGVANCNSKLYPEDTVFITARGTVGKVALAAVPMAINQSCYALIGKGYPQRFLFGFTQWASERLRTMSNGAVFDTIIVDTFRKLELPIPTLELARAYEDKAIPILDMARVVSASIQRLTASRDLLLPRLISGQLSVTDAERSPEDAA